MVTQYPPILETICGLAPELSPKAQYVFIFDTLKKGSLVSIGQLCDDDCIALFAKYDLKTINNNKVIINGPRKKHGLWNISLNKPIKQSNLHPTSKKPASISTNTKTSPSANVVIRADKTKAELAQFLSGACFNPVPSTFLRAIRRNHTTS